MRVTLSAAAEILALAIAAIILLGLGINWGACNVIGQAFCAEMSFNDHLRTSFVFGPMAVVTIGLVVALFIVVFGGIASRRAVYSYARRRLLPTRSVTIRRHANPTRLGWLLDRRLIIMPFLLASMAALLAIFSPPWHDIPDFYEKSRSQLIGMISCVPIMWLITGMSCLFLLHDSLDFSISRRESGLSPARRNRVFWFEWFFPAFFFVVSSWLTLAGFGVAEINTLLNNDGALVANGTKSAEKMIILRVLDSGLIIFDHCTGEVKLIPGADVSITRSTNRDFSCTTRK